MGDIVITSGLEEPYTIPYTDPKEAQSLRNLLIGKFAFLGSEAGVQLKKQTLEMQKVVDSVNYVSDILDEIKTPLVWSDKPNLLLNLDDQIGYPIPKNINIPLSDVDEFIYFTKILNNSGLNFGLSTNYIFKRVIEGQSVNQVLENTSIKIISNYLEAAEMSKTYPNLIFATGELNSTKTSFFLYSETQRSNPIIEISRPEAFVIPQSESELSIWEEYPSILQAFNNTKDLLLNETILYTPGGVNPDPASIINSKVNINANMAMVKDLMGGAVPYIFKKVSPTDKLTQDIHTVFTLTDDKNIPPKYYFSSAVGIVNELNPTNFSVTPFIYKPTNDDVQSWRSQFTEKQVQLTQKSATLQNFLNELIQIYNYTFEAATNLLRAFSSLLSDISRNIN